MIINKQSHMRAEECKKIKRITLGKAELIKHIHSDIDETWLNTCDHVAQFTAGGTHVVTWRHTTVYYCALPHTRQWQCFIPYITTIKCATTIFLTRLVLWENKSTRHFFTSEKKVSVSTVLDRSTKNTHRWLTTRINTQGFM